MQNVPIFSMSTKHGTAQVHVGKELLISRQQFLNSRIRHGMAIRLSGDVVFHDVASCRPDAADRIVPLKCFGLPSLNQIPQASFDTANHFRRRDVCFGADEELACVVLSKSVFEDANTVGLGRGLQFREPFLIRNRAVTPKNGEPQFSWYAGVTLRAV